MKRAFMKSKVLKTLLLALTSAALLASCGDKKKEAPAAEQASTETEAKAAGEPEAAGIGFDKEELNAFFNQYFSLKESLVASDPARAQEIARGMGEIGLEGMPEVSKSIAALAASDNLGEQRAIFFMLSKAMVPHLESHLNSGEIYQQYCPMAFENTGAFWFSDSEEILNPYFGDAMLRCGKVEKTFGAL
ncbi:MAG: DUF3347 domain-containing protein [Bacteroidetes bacterium]|nr:MAG: DUF3347 domain-containing protein [Bacteroidota bacterium]